MEKWLEQLCIFVQSIPFPSCFLAANCGRWSGGPRPHSRRTKDSGRWRREWRTASRLGSSAVHVYSSSCIRFRATRPTSDIDHKTSHCRGTGFIGWPIVEIQDRCIRLHIRLHTSAHVYWVGYPLLAYWPCLHLTLVSRARYRHGQRR